jgi:hypothetical protein
MTRPLGIAVIAVLATGSSWAAPQPKPARAVPVTISVQMCGGIDGGVNPGNQARKPSRSCGPAAQGAIVESECDRAGNTCNQRDSHAGGKPIKLQLAPGTYRFSVDYIGPRPGGCDVALPAPQVVAITKARTVTLTYNQQCHAPSRPPGPDKR